MLQPLSRGPAHCSGRVHPRFRAEPKQVLHRHNCRACRTGECEANHRCNGFSVLRSMYTRARAREAWWRRAHHSVVVGLSWVRGQQMS
jgi:hypothetical protein